MVSTTAISAKQEQAFVNADIDDDGYLTQAEFEEGFPYEDMSLFDKDSDGKVSKEEYTKTILDFNKKIVDQSWKFMMKLFKLDKVKTVDEVVKEISGNELD